MTDKELRKLKRADLLELLLVQAKENEQQKERIAELERQLADRELMLQESGSIAEAALRLNGIFEDAQRAADLYLENVRRIAGVAECQPAPAQQPASTDTSACTAEEATGHES